METVTTDDSVVKEYNPYREAELMERREIVISYMGGNMNRSMREILKFRIAQKKILYQVISDICHTMYGLGLGKFPVSPLCPRVHFCCGFCLFPLPWECLFLRFLPVLPQL
ncbi:hypothetical protein Naga_101179g1 [Nannochloropsis gaditana]|uniref:Uncharacterized protein n=1 Tax=Nannochloropsis gaditana TaxID=72520 RepID=W7T3Z7_9STRA|nr:hypothetical protein Naga_101179g1 [Nannochloropsis gaditana]